jgi:hypothetical protein
MAMVCGTRPGIPDAAGTSGEKKWDPKPNLLPDPELLAPPAS